MLSKRVIKARPVDYNSLNSSHNTDFRNQNFKKQYMQNICEWIWIPPRFLVSRGSRITQDPLQNMQ